MFEMFSPVSLSASFVSGLSSTTTTLKVEAGGPAAEAAGNPSVPPPQKPAQVCGARADLD